MNISTLSPTNTWAEAAKQELKTTKNGLRLAAMAGHMQVDKVAARRAALIDLLADGRNHPREEIWDTISALFGEGCWGKLPREVLARDLAVLRRGGIRIAYARRSEIMGYYLQYPVLERPPKKQFAATSQQLIERIRQLSIPEKNRQAFAAANFALTQKRLILREEKPDWTPNKLTRKQDGWFTVSPSHE